MIDAKSFGRDANSRALINKDVSALVNYKRMRDNNSRVTTLENEVSGMRSELHELTKLIRKLVE